MRSSLFAGIAAAFIAVNWGGVAFSQDTGNNLKLGLGYLPQTKLEGERPISGNFKATLVPSAAVGINMLGRNVDLGLSYIPNRDKDATGSTDKIKAQLMPFAALAVSLGDLDARFGLGYLPKTEVAVVGDQLGTSVTTTAKYKATLAPSAFFANSVGGYDFSFGVTYIPARDCDTVTASAVGVTVPISCTTFSTPPKVAAQFLPSASISISF